MWQETYGTGSILCLTLIGKIGLVWSIYCTLTPIRSFLPQQCSSSFPVTSGVSQKWLASLPARTLWWAVFLTGVSVQCIGGQWLDWQCHHCSCVVPSFLPSFPVCVCVSVWVQEMAEAIAADILVPPSPQSAPPTSSVPSSGIMAWASVIVLYLGLKEHVTGTVLTFEYIACWFYPIVVLS